MQTPVVSGLAVGVAFVILFSVILASSSSLQISNHTSRDNGQIVFSSAVDGNTHQIYLVNSDGTSPTRLTDEDDLWHFGPVSSPDGTKIAYITWDSFEPPHGKIMQDLFVINGDGTNKVLVTRNCQNNHEVGRHVWSPDGTKIAFEGADDIFVVDIDGTNCIRLSTDDLQSIEHKPVWASNSKIMFSNVFGNKNMTSVLGASLNEINIDGTGLRTLFDYDYDVDVDHIWSPDLSKISFIHVNDQDSASLYVMNADGNNLTKIADSNSTFPLAFENMEWSPDGQKIAFEHLEGDYHDIYVVNVKDGSLKKLSNSKAYDGNPVWSPDGKKIAFTRIIPEGEISGGIYVMNAKDGSEQMQVAKIESSIVNVPLDWLS
ncbi:MAG: hypothetical protein AB1351_04600 [Thermoproteota archaeon]